MNKTLEVIGGIFLGLAIAFGSWYAIDTPAHAGTVSPITVTASCKANHDVVVKVKTTRPVWVSFFGVDTGEDAHVKVDGSVSFRTGARLYNVTWDGQTVFPRDPIRNNC